VGASYLPPVFVSYLVGTAVTDPLLSMKNISKSFGGVPALVHASLEVYPAEVMALVGQNGAGKSTMIKILNGAYARDSGTITFGGVQWTAGSPQQAQRSGSAPSSRK